MPEDMAIILSKSDIDPCNHGRDIDSAIKCRQTAFQLYISSRLIYFMYTLAIYLTIIYHNDSMPQSKISSDGVLWEL